MAFTDPALPQDVVALLQRSLERGRLGHAYLFVGAAMPEMEAVARTLAKTLNCAQPPRRGPDGRPLDCCDVCASCRRTDTDTHPDVAWVRAESKLRVIKIEQIRELLRSVALKPTCAPFKVAILVAADRLTGSAASAFLKTLEEPPADSVFLLLSSDPDRLPETILSRCLRLNFAGDAGPAPDPGVLDWVQQFGELAVSERGSLLSRYRLLSALLGKLGAIREEIKQTLSAQSPLERYKGEELDPDLRKKWEAELDAAIEAEYRRRRAALINGLHWWLRDVAQAALGQPPEKLSFPRSAAAARAVAGRVSAEQALANLEMVEQTQRLLFTNVQEALALEVGLLRLHL